ncbi:sulfatase [Bacteroidia bacterium]|nr:sulfatase [Bacteroidia bacterium]
MAIQKPIFMLYHIDLAKGSTIADWLNVIIHGLKLDLTMAGYLTIIPLLCIIASVWAPVKYLKKGLKVYFILAITLVAIMFFIDIALYTFWGFRLDATLIFYLQFPGGAMVSVPVWLSIRQALLSIIYILAAVWLFNRGIMATFPSEPVKRRRRIPVTAALIVFGAFLFLPIRGSVTTSTSNVGMVYFSNRQFLNHSAINPVFSLATSLFKQLDFASQFQFFSEEKRDTLFRSLFPESAGKAGSAEVKTELLNTKRPDILLVILESFSANVVEAVGGEPEVTPCLNRLAEEGVLFTNIYANSFRTDRGLVSVLNGYFAQPTTSIMKYPAKSQSLPSLAKSLSGAGYTADMLYGGDINYTNMRSYFFGSGYSRIASDQDFPLSSRLNKWGANDDITFDYMFHSLQEKNEGHRFSTFLTISSHEPFKVPYSRLKDPYLNSVAFTDSCVGNFIDRLKETPVWDNLLVVFIADHGYRYPATLTEFEPARYHIPVLWVGGAVKQPAKIETIASQTDLAATLLSQLDIPYSGYTFSKDILDPKYEVFAFYTFSNGFGFVDKSGASAYDNDSNRPVMESPQEGGEARSEKGKALLQTLYDDLGNR